VEKRGLPGLKQGSLWASKKKVGTHKEKKGAKELGGNLQMLSGGEGSNMKNVRIKSQPPRNVKRGEKENKGIVEKVSLQHKINGYGGVKKHLHSRTKKKLRDYGRHEWGPDITEHFLQGGK